MHCYGRASSPGMPVSLADLSSSTIPPDGPTTFVHRQQSPPTRPRQSQRALRTLSCAGAPERGRDRDLELLPARRLPVDGKPSFDAQMRLHPAASRIKRLAADSPATFIVFDCLLREARKPLLEKMLAVRRRELEALFARFGDAEGVQLTALHARSAEGALVAGRTHHWPRRCHRQAP